MHSPKKNGMPPAAALALIFLLFWAGPLLPAQAQAANEWGGVSLLPGMGELPGFQAGAGEQLTPYQAGVQAYLKGNDVEAIFKLREALLASPGDEKANRLLLKVMLRAINGNYERNNSSKAHSLIQDAYKYFPDNPEVKLLYSAMSEARAADQRKKNMAAPQIKPALQVAPYAGRAAPERAVKPRPEPQPAVEAVRVVGSSAPVIMREAPVPGKKIYAPYFAYAKDKAVFLTAAAAVLLLSAALFIVIYLQQQREKVLLLQIESLRKALVEGEVKQGAIYRELETRRNADKQDEELAALRQAKEQRMYLELEKLKAVEEAKFRRELEEKRAAAERAEQAPPRPAVSPEPPPVSRAPQAQRPAQRQPANAKPAAAQDKTEDSKILEMLVDLTPPEREAAWERIAVRAADIYADSPEAAINFLYELAKDARPLNRASIVGALAAIGAPATLDLLLELYNDPSLEVRREAIKHLTKLERDVTLGIDPGYLEKISACLRAEKNKGDWVF